MLDYPPGYEIDSNTITPGGISAVMAVTRPRGCRLRCCLRCRLRRCPRCRLDRGTRAGSGGRRTGRGARSSAGATVRRRERTPLRPYVGTVGPALGGRRGRTAYGPCAGIRSGPVRCGGGVVASRVAETVRQAGRRAGGKGRERSFSPGDGGAGPPGHGTTCRGRLEPDARSNDRSAVRRSGSPAVASARGSPQPVCTRPPSRPDSGSRARRLSRARPQSPQSAAASAPPPEAARRLSRSCPPPLVDARPKPPAQPARTPRAQCPLSPPRVPSAGR